MMERRKKLGKLYVFGTLVLLLSCFSVYFYLEHSKLVKKHHLLNVEFNKMKAMMNYEGENLVKLKVKYSGWSSGNEYPQYLIDSVLFTDNEDYNFYLNKEIRIEYVNDSLEKNMTIKDCSTSCFYWILSGNFSRNRLGMYRLDVNSGELFITDQCCDK